MAPSRPGEGALAESILWASRALIAVAARSLAGVEEQVTLGQYRALVVLASRGPQRMADLAAALDLSPSAATRLSDRLVAKALVQREESPGDRREVVIRLQDAGRKLLDRVTARRKRDIQLIVDRLPAKDRSAVERGLRLLAGAAGEVPESAWWLAGGP